MNAFWVGLSEVTGKKWWKSSGRGPGNDIAQSCKQMFELTDANGNWRLTWYNKITTLAKITRNIDAYYENIVFMSAHFFSDDIFHVVTVQ